MGHTAHQEQKLLGKIVSLYKLVTANQDGETAEKVRELGKKAMEKEFSIAFCGHFSAGKSSMINRLIGENILPSSPIPTSANLVKIKSGAEYAKVFFRNGGSRLYAAPYDYETVKNFCTDGNEIQGIEISHSGAEFLQHAVIIDTPGIDSTDDAHRIAAESALHLSDIVFYVMDYNHVQSELNFLFTKELTDAGKELYLIINQVDKHQDDELPFEQFKDSVQAAFSDWEVKHSGIFYTSLKVPELSVNQFDELRKFIIERKSKRSELLPVSIFRSLEKLSEDHLSHLEQDVSAQIDQFESILADLGESDREQLSKELDGIRSQITNIKRKQDPEQEFRAGQNDILKNAYLMPFQTRELAEAYLQSRQPDFKVGLFFSKQKTEQEKAARLSSFYKDLEEKVQSQLDWHIKDFLAKLFRKYHLSQAELQTAANGFKIDFGKELLSEAVKSGARLSGDYVLNYTNDVAEALKNRARKKLEPIKKMFLHSVKLQEDEQVNELVRKEQKYGKLLDAWEELSRISGKIAENRRQVSEILYGEAIQFEDEVGSLFFADEDEPEVIRNLVRGTREPLEKKVDPLQDHAAPIEQEEREGEQLHHVQQKLIGKLNYAADQIEAIPGLKKISRELKDKAMRIKDREFTVALFGAFSAGKSSFANALVGERILPVSPNPTTAAINKIKPVTKDHPHGSVIVKMKTDKQLKNELERSLRLFGEYVRDFEGSIDLIKTIKLDNSEYSVIEKTHYSFLQAFANGFDHFRDKFGEQLSVDMDSFGEFVAQEEKSCFVESIEVYYDCELTRKGITLVDTPGADSINARHTGVAFDYIKNSDAILFVTYYNHAFSKADREFLLQLGRVKDSFELDKMFFLVNAVDLANSEEEQETVLEYVEGQLVQYGIRKPQLFPVSSLKGLKDKLQPGSSGDQLFNSFEKVFYRFIAKDLMTMAVESAEAKWQQAISMLEKIIRSAEEDKATKAEKRQNLLFEKDRMLTVLAEKSPNILEERFKQEADELVYYIRQRVFLRFGDLFRESFHPALLKDDGRNVKMALESALDDLIGSIGYDLAQEMRATSLRMENYIVHLLKEFQQAIITELEKMNAAVSISLTENGPLSGMEFEPAYQSLDRTIFKKTLGLFKNPRAFFEKNEKRYMAEELERLLHEPSTEYLQEENSRLKNHYLKEMQQEFEKVQNDFSEQINEYFEGITASLEEKFSVDLVKQALTNLIVDE